MKGMKKWVRWMAAALAIATAVGATGCANGYTGGDKATPYERKGGGGGGY